jgi:light-regulated signal transduction histidine kinase (bacteriophytochrome)
MAAAEEPAAGAKAAAGPLLGMAAADGAVLKIDAVWVCVGTVPSVRVLDLLVPHLAEQVGADPEPLASDTLPDLVGMPGDDDAANTAAAMA